MTIIWNVVHRLGMTEIVLCLYHIPSVVRSYSIGTPKMKMKKLSSIFFFIYFSIFLCAMSPSTISAKDKFLKTRGGWGGDIAETIIMYMEKNEISKCFDGKRKNFLCCVFQKFFVQNEKLLSQSIYYNRACEFFLYKHKHNISSIYPYINSHGRGRLRGRAHTLTSKIITHFIILYYYSWALFATKLIWWCCNRN